MNNILADTVLPCVVTNGFKRVGIQNPERYCQILDFSWLLLHKCVLLSKQRKTSSVLPSIMAAQAHVSKFLCVKRNVFLGLRVGNFGKLLLLKAIHLF